MLMGSVKWAGRATKETEKVMQGISVRKVEEQWKN